MSSFLDRFAGKTQTISKLGVDEMLKGKQNITICTRSSKMANPFKKHKFLGNKVHTETVGDESLEDETLHLPQIEQRYTSNNKGSGYKLQDHSRVYFDKETNWFIEQDEPKIKKQEVPQQPVIEISHKDNIEVKARVREESKELQKTKKNQLSVHHLGGLGANIGGQQWQLRKEKQQKAKKYATDIKRINCKKREKESEYENR